MGLRMCRLCPTREMSIGPARPFNVTSTSSAYPALCLLLAPSSCMMPAIPTRSGSKAPKTPRLRGEAEGLLHHQREAAGESSKRPPGSACVLLQEHQRLLVELPHLLIYRRVRTPFEHGQLGARNGAMQRLGKPIG
jgi:hypothetical protein